MTVAPDLLVRPTTIPPVQDHNARLVNLLLASQFAPPEIKPAQ